MTNLYFWIRSRDLTAGHLTAESWLTTSKIEPRYGYACHCDHDLKLRKYVLKLHCTIIIKLNVNNYLRLNENLFCAIINYDNIRKLSQMQDNWSFVASTSAARGPRPVSALKLKICGGRWHLVGTMVFCQRKATAIFKYIS